MPVILTVKPKFKRGVCLYDCPHLMMVVDHDGYYHKYICCVYQRLIAVCTDEHRASFESDMEEALKNNVTMRAVGCLIDFGKDTDTTTFKEASHDNS